MHTQVILKQDVKNLGRVGQVVRVKRGYARNYLFPRSLAVEVTERRLKEQAHLQAMAEAKIKKAADARSTLAERVGQVTLEFTRAADASGQLFGSVTAFNIATELEKQVQTGIGRRDVLIEAPLKKAGESLVSVDLGHGIKAEVKVCIHMEVVKSDEDEPVAKKEAVSEVVESQQSKESSVEDAVTEDVVTEEQEPVVDAVDDSEESSVESKED